LAGLVSPQLHALPLLVMLALREQVTFFAFQASASLAVSPGAFHLECQVSSPHDQRQVAQIHFSSVHPDQIFENQATQVAYLAQDDVLGVSEVSMLPVRAKQAYYPPVALQEGVIKKKQHRFSTLIMTED